MRGSALVALVFITLGAAATVGAAGKTPGTALTVTYWENGANTSDRVTWTIRCNPARGTHPRPATACRRLEEGGWKLVAPVPASAICTEIYGGPQVARVVGVLQGRKVWARFSRENGCQISRWSRLSPWLFPAGGVTG